jgi:hypothetical protein
MVTRAKRMSQFEINAVPSIGLPVEVLCEDHCGTYTPPFLCRWTDHGWANARTSRPLDADVLGWRPRERKFG